MSWTLSPEIQGLINQQAQAAGLDPRMLSTMAWIESRGNPSAQNPNSSAGGLFQQLDANAREYGVGDRFDPAQSTAGAVRFARQNQAYLESRLGRPLQPWEYYLAHQQGPGGALSILRDPSADAASVLGADAVRLNGGRVGMTLGEFGQIWEDRFNGYYGAGGSAGAGFGPAAPAAGAAVGGTVSDAAFQRALATVQPQNLSNSQRMAGLGQALINLETGSTANPLEVAASSQPLSLFEGLFNGTS